MALGAHANGMTRHRLRVKQILARGYPSRVPAPRGGVCHDVARLRQATASKAKGAITKYIVVHAGTSCLHVADTAPGLAAPRVPGSFPQVSPGVPPSTAGRQTMFL